VYKQIKKGKTLVQQEKDFVKKKFSDKGQEKKQER
jgi:hypothetical protein